MTIKRLIGSAPSQISRNKDLGNLAFQNKESVYIEQMSVNGVRDLPAATLTTTSTTQTALTSFSSTAYGCGKFVIQATSGSARHITELLITHDGSTAVATEYGVVRTGSSLFAVDVDISSGNVRVLITSASSTSTTYKTFGDLIRI